MLGATHPHVLEQSGETYRLMLEARAQRLGVDASMIFHNRFVSQAELGEFLSAADIYITPYLKPEQITSGTLAYAVGAGKAVISTPYRYASELLAEGRGILVPWRNSDAIAGEVIGLLADEAGCVAMRQRAAAYGRGMAWGPVARRHVTSLERAVVSHAERRRSAFQARTLAERPASLPELNLDHLQSMTDDTGILQHASFSVPRYDEGYCLDDNARALMLMVRLEEAGSVERRTVRALASRYLAFVSHAFIPPPAASGTSSRTSGPGAKRAAPRTATAAPCGRWARWSAARAIPAGGAWAAISFTRRCRRSLTSRARAPGPTRCSASTSTSRPSKATPAYRRCGSCSPRDCSASTSNPAPRTGRGSRTA